MQPAEEIRKDVILEALKSNLEGEGLEVFVHPSRAIMPSFLDPYRPDAIALSADRKIVIDVVVAPVQATHDAPPLRDVLRDHPGWEHLVYYAPRQSPAARIAVSSPTEIEVQLARIMSNAENAGPAASLLIGWSAFEAASRLCVDGGLVRPQPAAALVEKLAGDGYVTPDEADLLRRLGSLRNEAAHGRLDAPVSQSDIRALVDITRTLLAQVESH